MQQHKSQEPARATASWQWFGQRGMVWDQLLPKLKELPSTRPPPSRLVIHLGGNNLGSTPIGLLSRKAKNDLFVIKNLMPLCSIYWSDVLTRVSYRGAIAHNKIEKARKAFNKMVRTQVTKMSGVIIKHPGITWQDTSVFRHDGVHLWDKGNAILWEDFSRVLGTC